MTCQDDDNVFGDDFTSKREEEWIPLPSWTEEEEDNESEEEEYSNNSTNASFSKAAIKRKHLKTSDTDADTDAAVLIPHSLCILEMFSDEVFALILSHLSLQEIANCSLVSTSLYGACRSNTLWQQLFTYRWNYKPPPPSTSTTITNDQDEDEDWFVVYQQAHFHPHDLWITHWNCVFPDDGVSPGRCYIPSKRKTKNAIMRMSHTKQQQKQQQQQQQTSMIQKLAYCPNCRNNNDLVTPVDDIILHGEESLAQLMAVATERYRSRRAVLETNMQRNRTSTSSSSSQRAFAKAATFHRKLSTQQYHTTTATNFLTDLLFFNLTDPITSEGQWELQQLLTEEQDKLKWVLENANNNNNSQRQQHRSNPDPSLSALYETAHHSWHVIQLFNPDFYRPILFQIGIQRPDCFTAYPSQGYLEPGERIYVTIGVRPTGSAAAYAFEALNVKRDGLAVQWADFYTEQAHLPMAPVLVRYHFCSAIQPINVTPMLNNNNNHDNIHENNHSIDNNNHRDDVPQNNRNNNTNQTRRIFSLHSSQSISLRGEASTRTRTSTTDTTTTRKLEHPKLSKRQILEYHRKNAVPTHQTRTIYLSAHVNAHYLFSDFIGATLQSWNLQQQQQQPLGPIFNSPILRETYPSVYHRLENIFNGDRRTTTTLQQQQQQQQQLYTRPEFASARTTTTTINMKDNLLGIVHAHSEPPCQSCKHKWGLREEELRQAYDVAMGESIWKKKQRLNILKNIHKCLTYFQTMKQIDGNVYSMASLFYTIHCILLAMKASPWTTFKQKYILLQLENVVDHIYRQIITTPASAESNDHSLWIPWRLPGVYRHTLCTDSVFGYDISQKVKMLQQYGGGSSSTTDREVIIDFNWKDEPDYLDAFRHLAHSPGRYCLGPQEDPNHLEETTVSEPSRYARKQKGFMTDLFMDDPISALQAGICMIRDPRSLLVHGVYDQILYPGTIVRRPKVDFHLHYLLASDDAMSVKSPLGSIATMKLLATENRLHYYQLQNGLSLSDIVAVDSSTGQSRFSDFPLSFNHSMQNYQSSVPPPGEGRIPLSSLVAKENEEGDDIQPFQFETESSVGASENATSVESIPGTATLQGGANNANAQQQRAPLIGGNHVRGPRFLHLLWLLGARLGLSISDDSEASLVYVNRNILIASQWVGISFMAVPMFWTLFARYAHWIPAQPVEYNLEQLPFQITNEMRFLTEEECGGVAALLFVAWLALGRWTERHTSRDFFRVMLEHTLPFQDDKKGSSFRRFLARLSLRYQRQWDAICPLFLQRRVFTPQWNLRKQNDLIKHIAFWRSRRLAKERSVLDVEALHEGNLFGDCYEEGIKAGKLSSARKLIIGIAVALGSFCSSSPHFWLNLVSVFSCSISLGMSVSLHSMENGRTDIATNSTGSMIKEFSVVTIVILACLVGQLVGSSGGTMFLAEFIVTSISLILGGAGTISASAMESWGCFFCLSSTAFWGYLFGRVALMDGIRHKRDGYSSVLLSKAVLFLFFFWVFVFMVSSWEVPVSLVIVSPAIEKNGTLNRKEMIRKLQ